MNIEEFEPLEEYLRERGHVGADESVRCSVLSGGVSCSTVLVRRTAGPDFVVKQALARLKVREEWLSDPRRIHNEAAAMRELSRITPEGSVPRLLFEDQSQHLIGMEAVAEPHENWKQMLLSGRVERDHVVQFARLLASIHRGTLQNDEIRGRFADTSFFIALRREPYYEFTASKVQGASSFLKGLIADSSGVSVCLVHGDYSPKNILVHQNRLVLLDHEVAHFGDGAFDVGFSMTHLISKARHVAGKREAFLEAARLYWEEYRRQFAVDGEWEARSVRHTIGCMLARVRGKSPLEYLNEQERESQQRLCLELMHRTPGTMAELLERVE